MPATEEQFETFDDDGNPTGLKPRSEVHRNGNWHRSAQLFLYTATGNLLVHKRAADKDLYADLWDHSIGEHLQPGEDYLAGALRGAQEEFGLQNLKLRPLGSLRRITLKDPDGAWWDREMQQSFIATYDAQQHGVVQPDAAEVAQVDQWSPSALQQWMANQPAQLTPWFQQDLEHHKLMPSS